MDFFTLNKVNNRLEVKLNKGIYVEEALLLRKAFEEHQINYKDISVDMESVDFVDSTGLGVLVSMKKKIDERNGDVYLHNVHENILELIRLTRLDALFKINAEVG